VKKFVVLLILSLAGPLLGGEPIPPTPVPPPNPNPLVVQPTIKMPEAIEAQPGRLAAITIESTGTKVVYSVLGDADAFREYDPDPFKVRIRIISYTPGVCYVVASTALSDTPAMGFTRVTFAGPAPTPTPVPVPPGPGPAPTPTPVPGGFRVLFLTDPNAATSRQALVALNSTALRDYLTKKCEKDSTGRPAYRFWTKGIDMSKEGAADWKQLWSDVSDKVTSYPSVVISVGQKATIYPLPDGDKATDELMALLKKFGGD
jgi:hypothetical protein